MGGTPVRILLARHGETIFNVEGRWQGQTDSPLTERGRAQARELARAIAAEHTQHPIAAVYTSDLGRAYETAASVAHAVALEPRPDARLREVHVGAWSGLGRVEIDRDFPGGLHQWATTPARYVIPQGEAIHLAEQRALEFFQERMPRHPGETVVVISHGALCQVVLVNAMRKTVDDLWLKERMDNCQISRLEWSDDEGLRLIQLSDVRHLEEVGSLRTWRTTDSSPRA